MKKITIFALIFLSGFILNSCTEEFNEYETILNSAYNELLNAGLSYDNIEFYDTFNYKGHDISVSWSSSDESIINRFGYVYRLPEQDREVVITAVLTYQGYTKKIEFTVQVPPYSELELLNNVLDSIKIDRHLSKDLVLPTSFDYGIKANWISSDENILTNDGKVSLNYSGETVNLTVTLSLGGQQVEKQFNLFIPSYFIIDKFDDFKSSSMNNLKKDNNQLILNDNALEGYYESEVFDTYNFKSLVGSWGVETSTDRTTELLVKVRVDGAWTDYFSYGEWGLGLNNKAADKNQTLAKMSADEIIINNARFGDGVQYKMVLRRKSLDVSSPRMNLVALTIDIPGFVRTIDTNALPESVDYVVPQLNQNIVPTIGNSICSPTSVTMLLKYKGYDFSSYDEYEHRYIAGLARDYGNLIYGNWVYNTAVMGAYGEISYVKRLYSLAELQEHLANVGPVAASVKGNMQSQYTTNGHLIVIRGYKYIDGVLHFICNDPNLKNVYFEYRADTIQNVWRNIIYVIE